METEKIEPKKNGGRRPGSGRKKGVPNKVTSEVRSLAQQYGAEVIEMLVDLARNGEAENTRVAAGRELLDRAYGKPTQYEETKGNVVLEVITGVPRGSSN